MSAVVDKAVEKLSAKVVGGFDAVAKFVIEGEGSIMLDADGVRAGDGEADVTLTASRETFERLLAGDLKAMNAFMSGKLKLDGPMGLAMKLGNVLS